MEGERGDDLGGGEGVKIETHALTQSLKQKKYSIK